MIKPLIFLTFLTAFAYAAPQGSPLCGNIPKNPYANQIDSKYLQIPGCGGDTSPNDTPASIPIVNLDASSAPPVAASIPSTPPVAAQSRPAVGNVANPSMSAGAGGSQPSSAPSSQPSSASYSSTGQNDLTTGAGVAIGKNYSSSITRYGKGPDGTPGTDGQCQTQQGSCGNNPKYGYTAAASEFLYFNGGEGVGSEGNAGGGSGGKSCGTCWRIEGGNDYSGNPIAYTPIVVLITNECATQLPGQEVNLCSQTGYHTPNALQQDINIDICMDSGGTQAFWGNPPWGTTTGSAQQVNCSEWCGEFADGRKSGPEGCTAPQAPWTVAAGGSPSTSKKMKRFSR